MPPDMFEQALLSLKGYFGVVGVFGGNPAMSPHFETYCELMRKHVPFEQRGLWCNNLLTPSKGRAAAETFNPAVSNLNVHLDREAWNNFQQWWPAARPFGLDKDSRHSPTLVAMKDVLKKECPGCDGEGSLMYQLAKEDCLKVGGHRRASSRNPTQWTYCTADDKEIELKTVGGSCRVCNGEKTVYDEARAWELISRCDINRNWSAMIGMFRGKLRAWFCEIAGAQSILHQDEPDYPDTGIPIKEWGGMHGVVWAGDHAKNAGSVVAQWWRLPMDAFANQVRKHCHECGVPLRGRGEMAQADKKLPPEILDGTGVEPVERVSVTHEDVCKPKRRGRRVELVTVESQLGHHPRDLFTSYLEK